MSKAKRIPWNPDFLVTDNNQVFNTKTNKYLSVSDSKGVNIPYKGKQNTRHINTLKKHAFEGCEDTAFEPQTLEQWDQISDCKDFAISTEDRLKNIRFNKIIIPNADGKLRFYNEKKILEMDIKDIRDYFFAEDEASAPEQKAEAPAPEQKDKVNAKTPAPEQKAEAPEQKSMDEDQWWDDDDDELIIDDWDDDGKEIIKNPPKKEPELVQYGVPIKTATGFKVISDPRDVPPEYREPKYKGEPIELPDIDDCTDKELAEREIAQNQFLDELWAKWEIDKRGYR